MNLKEFFRSIALMCLCFLSLSIYGQNTADPVRRDSVIPATADETAAFLERLDSLYLDWINGQLPLRPYADTLAAFVPVDRMVDVPDSIFIQRLRTIPSGIELTYNKQVRSYLDLYTKNRRKQVSIMLGLGDYYFPMIEAKLDAMDLPLELKYLPVIESGLNPVARSRVGAQGMWQFMLNTARIYRLKVNSFVDERLDPVRSTEVACIYLKELYKIFGDWHLVIAAYNCGPGNVKKAIHRAGGKSNYWDIYYYLPRETRGFVPAFIAATYIMNFPEDHGFTAIKPEIPIETDTVMVSQELHLGQVSEVLDINLNTLSQLNPKYRKHILPGTGEQFDLRLPADKIGRFITFQDSILNHKDEVYLAKNNIDKEPAERIARPVPPSGDEVELTYVVKSGDNLGFIASWFEVGLSSLKDWNGLYSNRIKAGQKLVVYVPKSRTDEFRDINNMTFAEKQAMIGKENGTGQMEEPPGPVMAGLNDQFVTYVVKKGDNLWTIAQKFPGITNEDIMRLNQMSTNKLQIGQVLKIKRKEG
jgi:membrane-bound lytic murein transglycosylase D